MLRLRGPLAILATIAVLFAAGAVSAPTASAARSHRCAVDLPNLFPGVSSLRATRVGCREARGVASGIWTEIHRKSWKGEEFELPKVVGPVRRRTFSCGYHAVEDAINFLYYAARCSSGRSVVRLHLSS
jgi:hypothetical protein